MRQEFSPTHHLSRFRWTREERGGGERACVLFIAGSFVCGGILISVRFDFTACLYFCEMVGRRNIQFNVTCTYTCYKITFKFVEDSVSVEYAKTRHLLLCWSAQRRLDDSNVLQYNFLFAQLAKHSINHSALLWRQNLNLIWRFNAILANNIHLCTVFNRLIKEV